MDLEQLLAFFEKLKDDETFIKSPEAYLGMAVDFTNKDCRDLSDEVIKLGVERKMLDDCDLNNLGMTFLNANYSMDAMRVWELALQLGQKNPDIYYNLSLFHEDHGEKDIAISLLEEAISSGHDIPETYTSLSMICSKYGDDEKAIEVLNQAIAGRKLNDRVFIGLALLYEENGKKDKAIKTLETAMVDEGIINAQLLNDLAVHYLEIGEHEKAKKLWKQAVRSGIPEWVNEHVYYNLAHSYAISGDLETAQSLLFEATSKQFINDNITTLLSFCLYKSGHKGDMRNLLEKAVESGFTNPEIRFNLAYSYFKEGQEDEAERVARAAIESGETVSDIFVLLSEVDKEYDHLPDLLEIIKPDSNRDYTAYFHLAAAAAEKEIDGKNSTEFLRMMVNQIAKNKEFHNLMRDYIKTTRNIKIIGSNFTMMDSIIVKESIGASSENPFNDEIRNLHGLRSLSIPDVSFAVPVDSFQYGDKWYFVMTRGMGTNATELINDDSLSSEQYERMLRTLPIINVMMPKHERERYDFAAKVPKNIQAVGFRNLIEHFDPVISVLNSSSNWGYCKDPYTDNWLLLENGQILVVDTEEKGETPLAADLAHFLNCIPYYQNVDDRVGAALRYVGFVNDICDNNVEFKDGKVVDADDFVWQFLNASIYRGAEKFGYFNALQRPDDAKKCLKAAVDTIEYIGDTKIIGSDDFKPYDKIRKIIREER